jgi:hypothetical protein
LEEEIYNDENEMEQENAAIHEDAVFEDLKE